MTTGRINQVAARNRKSEMPERKRAGGQEKTDDTRFLCARETRGRFEKRKGALPSRHEKSHNALTETRTARSEAPSTRKESSRGSGEKVLAEASIRQTATLRAFARPPNEAAGLQPPPGAPTFNPPHHSARFRSPSVWSSETKPRLFIRFV